MTPAQTKKKAFIPADNPIEQLKDLGVGAASDIASVPTDIFNNALEQIGLKPRRKPMSGEINLATGVQKTNQEATPSEVPMDRKVAQLHSIQNQEKEIFNAQKKATEAQINKVMQELAAEVKQLQAQTSELAQEVKNVTVESMPSSVGKYHLNFFEWVITMLKDLRQRVSESRQWLAMSTTKKQQKGYWAMFKKHGTSFAMSEERAIASANG